MKNQKRGPEGMSGYLRSAAGVTLMELLLVVAVMAVMAPIAVPPMTSYLAGRNDVAVTHQMVDMVSHCRTMGLMGRTAESVISFVNASGTVSAAGDSLLLPAGFTLGNFKVNGATSAALSVGFGINGNIVCNGSDAASASVDIFRDGTKISTVHMNGIGIPIPQMTASVDPANPSGSGSRRCRWF
jgi:type II secretory pathway pseudopilin PulG